MLRIQQFRYSADNFAYVIYGDTVAGVVDGGAVEKILTFLADRNLTLQFIANTHQHADHTVGTGRLQDRTGAPVLDNQTLQNRKEIGLEGRKVTVLKTPGHTADSLCFYFEKVLISGDTLFNGTIGNCFSGDLKGFLGSIKRLMALPVETVIYAGHDYVGAAMAFARSLEPENRAIDQFLKKYSPDRVFSSLQEELQVNPYLKFNDSRIIAVLEKKGLPVDTEYRRWESLMSLE
jgi:hydroxyacylglutathione hydrolase